MMSESALPWVAGAAREVLEERFFFLGGAGEVIWHNCGVQRRSGPASGQRESEDEPSVGQTW